jgi:hypothetical protein
MKTIAFAMLIMAASAGMAQAATPSVEQPAQPLAQGVIEQVASDAIVVNGLRYAYSPATTAVFNSQGVALSVPRLAPGRTIAYTLAPGSARPTLLQIWVVK